MSLRKPSIAIIGAGMSGLLAAQALQDHGLSFVIFEEKPNLGGVWHGNSGLVWSGMHTNISKATDRFPDFPWPEDTPDFPSAEQMYQYLDRFATKHNLHAKIHFNTPIDKLTPLKSSWLVNTRVENSQPFEVDRVIVASGIFAQASMPDTIPRNLSKGVFHSQDYKSAHAFANQDVSVVGFGFSACEIAADLCRTARSVTHYFHRPAWVVPKYLHDRRVPLDQVFYDQPSRVDWKEVRLRTSLANRQVNERFAQSYCDSLQSDETSPLFVSALSTMPQGVVISDEYMELVKSKKIIVRKLAHRLTSLEGVSLPVIFCTGYRCALPFFSDSVLKQLQFQHDDLFDPLPLYKATWHPAFSNLAFVGMYRGPFPLVLHAQAQWVAKVFSNQVQLPPKSMLETAIASGCAIRALPKNDLPQFPHWDYLGLLRDIQLEYDSATIPPPHAKHLSTLLSLATTFTFLSSVVLLWG